MELSPELERQVKLIEGKLWLLLEGAVFGGEWSLARDALSLIEVLSDYVS